MICCHIQSFHHPSFLYSSTMIRRHLHIQWVIVPVVGCRRVYHFPSSSGRMQILSLQLEGLTR